MYDDRLIEIGPLIEYIKESQRQSNRLFEVTGNLMWLGESIAYQHILEAIALGSIGEATA